MLLVRTKLQQSPIHGFGVFADEPIPKGTIVWMFREGFDFLVAEEHSYSLPEVAKEHLVHFGGLWKGNYCVFGDHAKFINHSETPNLLDVLDEDLVISGRDIQVGEELTEDYRQFAGESACFDFLRKP